MPMGKRIQSREYLGASTSDAYLGPRHLFKQLFAASEVGFGICDKELRYQAINDALAATNRRPAEAHLGCTVRDILGDVAAVIEPAFERVLETRKPVLKEISGRIPREKKLFTGSRIISP